MKKSSTLVARLIVILSLLYYVFDTSIVEK